jgi:hypothetical protein
MPRANVPRHNARISSFLLAVLGLSGLITLSAVTPDLMLTTAHAAAAFNVNSTGDGADSNTADGTCNDGAGNCTLRAALEQANALPGTDTINFQIGTGVQTIVLGAALPDVSDPVNIDGTTQPGYGGTPLIEVRGKEDGFTRIPWALHVTAGGSTVRALAVGRFDVAGILLGTEGASNAGGNKVEACYGGLRADGVTPSTLPMHGSCVRIADSPDNIVGGTTVAARNVLSGCGFGVDIWGTKSTGNLVQGNYIGTNAAGTAAVGSASGSQSIGVNIGNASNNVIGGDTAAARNVISGNSSKGVAIAGSAAGNAVKGNYIGTDAAGTAALPNGTGVEILSANNVVGGLALAPGVAPGNVIAGQPTNLQVNGSGALVQGNLIGLDATGLSGFAGSNFGIVCFAENVVIGGTQDSARNVISGVNTGVYIDGFGAAVIQGNFIGTTLWGLTPLGNVLGINVAGRGSQIGGTAAGAGNVISGNRQGVLLRSGVSTVQGNLIGTDSSGAAPLPNSETGIYIDGAANGSAFGASNSVIGGTAAGAGNRIAFNGRSGIAVGPYPTQGFFSTGNRLRGNSIFSNGLLGIDLVASAAPNSLDADGPSPNDVGDTDTGPNRMQNAPTLLTADAAGGTAAVSGRLDSAPNQTFAVDIFANSSCDPSGYGEGQTYLGSTQATTDASGVATFSASFMTPSEPGQVMTATSTDAAGNTSEFSACLAVNAPDAFQFTTPSQTISEQQTAHVVVSRTGGTAVAATVNYATSDITAKAGADYVAASGTLLFAPGQMTKSVDIALVDDALNEDEESFRVTLSNPTGGPALGTPITTDVRIYPDSDLVPLLAVGDSTVAEGDSGTTAAAFTVTLSAVSGRTVTVGYRTFGGSEGSDYNFTTGTLTFAPGETSKTFNVNVIGDTTPEPKESFDILLQDQSNAYFIDSVGTGTILNDDAALSVNDVTVTEGDSGQTALNFTVHIPFPTVNPVSINYASADGTANAGPDYGGTAGTLTFSPGEMTKAVTVHAFGDTFDEPDETFFLNLSGATNAAVADAQGLGTINNDDTPALRFSQAAYTVVEGAHFVTVTVTRTGDSSAPASISYSTIDGGATEMSDYNLTLGRLRFGPGETQKTLNVLINDDALVEPDETFLVSLLSPTGAILGTPSQATVTLRSDDSAPGPNPVGDGFDAQFFVRQHYHDFLNREPDASGFQFWTGEITQCGADARCREVKKINVSAAFFQSIEFQQTGFFVYRLSQVAYNTQEMLDWRTFLAHTQEVGRDVQVGGPDWEAKLEANKQAFADSFVTTAPFVSAYQGMSNAQYVDVLNANTFDPRAPGLGGALTPAERDQLVSDLNQSRKTRAQVLRAVAENVEFSRRQSNKAFVLMQYFGYLRRNPNSQPDTDFSGYSFWLGKLDEFNGNFIQAEMVKAFLDSIEYKRRFGR